MFKVLRYVWRNEIARQVNALQLCCYERNLLPSDGVDQVVLR